MEDSFSLDAESFAYPVRTSQSRLQEGSQVSEDSVKVVDVTL